MNLQFSLKPFTPTNSVNLSLQSKHHIKTEETPQMMEPKDLETLLLQFCFHILYSQCMYVYKYRRRQSNYPLLSHVTSGQSNLETIIISRLLTPSHWFTLVNYLTLIIKPYK